MDRKAGNRDRSVTGREKSMWQKTGRSSDKRRGKQKAAADNSRRDPKTDSEKSGGRKWRSDGQHSCRIWKTDTGYAQLPVRKSSGKGKRSKTETGSWEADHRKRKDSERTGKSYQWSCTGHRTSGNREEEQSTESGWAERRDRRRWKRISGTGNKNTEEAVWRAERKQQKSSTEITGDPGGKGKNNSGCKKLWGAEKRNRRSRWGCAQRAVQPF